jgi:phosphatidylglycerophosphate synthase
MSIAGSIPVTSTAADSGGVHVREHQSFLAEAERRTLIFLAARLPARLTPDHLTLLGLAAMGMAGGAFAIAPILPWSPLLVVPALALNWLGDSLDGTLARVRNQQRPRYGYYVDHVVDLVGITALLAGLGMSGHMSPLIAAGLLAAYLLVTAEAFLATHAVGIFRISCFGWGPTELRLVLAAGAVALLRNPWVDLGALGRFQLFDVGGCVAIAGLIVAFIYSASRNTRALSRREPRPVRSGARAA